MSRTDVEEVEKHGRDYLTANDRKTVKQFGPLATCCPATQHALKFVCAFLSKGGPPNWEPRPPQEEMMTVGFTKLKKRCCVVCPPNEEPMWITLKRKQQRSTEEDRGDKDGAMAKRCAAGGPRGWHGEAVHNHITDEKCSTSKRRVLKSRTGAHLVFLHQGVFEEGT